MPLFRLLTKCLLGSSLSLVVITDLEGGRHNPLPYILSYIPLLWLHPISHQGQGKQFVSKQYKAGCAVRLQHLPPAFMDYTKKSFNRATSFLTRKTPFLRKETSWDASERWPPSCRLQNVFIYFLEIQVIPEVEQRTIKLLSNKGHLPPTTSIKMLRDAPGSVQADIYQGRGTLSTLPHSLLLSWAPQEPAPVMPTPHFGGKLKFFGHKCRGGMCCCASGRCSEENAVGMQYPAHTNCPDDGTLHKPGQQTSSFFYFYLFSTVDFFPFIYTLW